MSSHNMGNDEVSGQTKTLQVVQQVALKVMTCRLDVYTTPMLDS